MSKKHKAVLIPLVASVALLTMGATECQPAPAEPVEHSSSDCDSSTPRGKGVRGVVAGDKYRQGGPYCLEIRKSGYKPTGPNDNRGIVWIRVQSKAVFDRCNWNAPWPDCRAGH